MRSNAAALSPSRLSSRATLSRSGTRNYHSSSPAGKTPLALQNASDEAFHPPEGQARLRFAPSPTGYLHLGGLRTALFNHLFARKWKGKWILRIEDTDRTRLVDDAISSLQRTLDWAGLDYDEGPGRGGDVGPYIQSERKDLYHQHAKTLLDKGQAYSCFCSPQQLAEIRKSQQLKKATTSYDGRCRHLTEEEVARRKRAGEKFVVRFKDAGGAADLPPDMIFGAYPSSSASNSTDIPSASWSKPQSPTSALLAPKTSESTELPAKGFRGPGSFNNRDKEFDDFILIKGDGYPTYHFASVVDDTSMGITHVFRGEEWLPSTPKHYQIYRALDWKAPHFAHLPLLVNPDGTKLSKRTGDVRVEDYISKGYESPALINFLSLIGWDHHHPTTPTTELPFFPLNNSDLTLDLGGGKGSELDIRKDFNSLSELYTMPMLIKSFSLERVGRTRGSVFLGKLDWLNKMHLRRMGMETGPDAGKAENGRATLIKRVKEMLQNETVLKGCARIDDEEYIGKSLDIELPRANVLQDIPNLSIFFFLRPDFENHEADSMYKDWGVTSSGRDRYADALTRALTSLQAFEGETLMEDDVARLIDNVSAESGMKRSGVMKVLRHALTGRKKGPTIPNIMSVLGRQESLGRLRDAQTWFDKRDVQEPAR